MKAVSQFSIELLLEAFKDAERSLLDLQMQLDSCKFNTLDISKYEDTIASSGFEIARLAVANKVNEIHNLETAVRGLVHATNKEQN